MYVYIYNIRYQILVLTAHYIKSKKTYIFLFILIFSNNLIKKIVDTEIISKHESDLVHATAFQLAIINARKGGQSYNAVFSLKNNTVHANDMFYFIGFHDVNRVLSQAEELMKIYYPKMIKNFVKYGNPDKGKILLFTASNNFLNK